MENMTFLISVLLAFSLGINTFVRAAAIPAPAQPRGTVILRFKECAGDFAVFVLENQTERPIYARAQRADHWQEYKAANMRLGVHFIEYKAPDAQSFVDVSPRWDAPIRFTRIPPRQSIRYGIYLNRKGEYRVEVPYLEDATLVRRMNQGIHKMTEADFQRLETEWEKVSSETVTNRCL